LLWWRFPTKNPPQHSDAGYLPLRPRNAESIKDLTWVCESFFGERAFKYAVGTDILSFGGLTKRMGRTVQ